MYYILGLEHVLQTDVYNHLLNLHVAVTILTGPLHNDDEMIDYAERILKYFVDIYPQIYGKHEVGPNVHGLTHLAGKVRNTKRSLDSISAWAFENFMQVVKKCVRKGDRPLAQLYRRYTEIVNNRSVNLQQPYKYPFTPCNSSIHENSPLLDHCNNPQYSKVKSYAYTLDCKKQKNSCFGTKDREIIIAENIAFHTKRNELVVIGRKFVNKTNAYITPCESKVFGIYKVEKMSDLQIWSLSEIIRKYYIVPTSQSCFVVIPLLHR